MRATIIIGFLLLAVAFVAAQETAAPAPEPGEKLHFRYEVGAEKTRTVTGWFEATKGKFHTVVLDLDGDGKHERRKLPVQMMPAGSPVPEYVQMMVSFPHEGATWQLQYFDMHQYLEEGMDRPEERFHFSWMVTKGNSTVSFAGGAPGFSDRPVAAAKAVRLGGEIEFEVTASTQGPKALVTLAVKDASGCRLNMVVNNGKPQPPRFTLKLDEVQKHSSSAPFG